MTHVKCYRKNYPRPQFVRENFISLDGVWSFAFDDEETGESGEWYRKKKLDRTIRVPFSYHTKLSGIGDGTRHDCVWYSRRLPSFGPGNAGKRLILHFEGSDYATKVWVNGKYIGMHEGGYDRFSFDVTNALSEGENDLTVEVRDSFDTDRPRGKQRWQDESFACFYVETTGLWKSVWCEFVPEEYVESLCIRPDLDAGKAAFTFVFHKVDPSLTVETVVSMDGAVVADTVSRVVRKVFSVDVGLVSEAYFFKVFPWQANDPKLYDVELTVRKNGEVIDRVGSYFGVHKAECRGSRFYSGNVPEYLRMVLAQGYWENSGLSAPDEEALLKDAELIKSLGFNGVRVHEKIEDERFYYYCDVLGLYATCEMPSFYEGTDSAFAAFTGEWERIVTQLRNHPCLVMWVPFNESWGLFHIAANRREQRFADGIYALTKAFDSRPVISNDGWEHTTSDIVTLHNYAETGKDLLEIYGNMTAVLQDENVSGAVPRRTFAEGYRYSGQPVMLTEFGGIAFQRDSASGWGYGSLAADERSFLNRLSGLVSAIRSMPALSGYCVTQFTDVQQEKNGILTIGREPKAPIEQLSALFTGESYRKALQETAEDGEKERQKKSTSVRYGRV